MPVPILINIVSNYYDNRYLIYGIIVVATIAVIRAYAQGRKTNRERDLHGRIVLLTGAFTSLGSTILEALASRGAHVIALTHLPVDAPEITLIIEAVRETTKNENIFAENCDLLDVKSTRDFCTKFLTGKEHRLDAIIFTHEYEHVGPLFASKEEKLACEERRAAVSDCTFLMITLLLPTLLVAPAERDIRIISVVNPFYAAAVPRFPTPPPVEGSQLIREGYRSLRTIVLTRHLQRVLDALPQAPALDPDTASVAAASNKAQKSNIVAVSVSPGFSRQDTVAPLLRGNFGRPGFSTFGLIAYILLLPLLQIITKTPSSAVQTVLHALFLPTPFKFASLPSESGQDNKRPLEEALKPGALYADCFVVNIDMRNRLRAESKVESSPSNLVDDAEYGGEALGRLIWEDFEANLKARGKSSAATPSKASTDKKDR